MKCPKCNAEVPDGQRFCGNCGTEVKIEQPAEPIQIHTDLTITEDMMDHYIESLPDDSAVIITKIYTNLSDQMKEADRIVKKAHEHLDYALPILREYQYKQKLWVKWLVLFIIFLVAFYVDTRWFKNTRVLGMFLHDLLSFIIIIGVVVCLIKLVISIVQSIIATKKCKEATEEKLAGIHILRAHRSNLQFLPQDYLNPLATEYLVKITANGRVKTLEEALDRCDQYLRHVENQEMLRQMQNSINSLRSEVSSLRGDVDFWSSLYFFD